MKKILILSANPTDTGRLRLDEEVREIQAGFRQMGKSSLLIRTIETAVTASKRVAFLDFQLFDKATLNNADSFFRQFCSWLTLELEMVDKVDEYWQMPLGNSQRGAMRFCEVLKIRVLNHLFRGAIAAK